MHHQITPYALPTSPKSLYKLLKDLKIEFKIFEHPPLFTVNDAKKYRENMHGFHTKNLFLRDKKKKIIWLSLTKIA